MIRTLLVPITLSLAAQLLNRGTPVVATVVWANFLSVESFGSYNYFVLTVSTLATFTSLGLGPVATKSFASMSGANVRAVWLWLVCASAVLSVAVAWAPPALLGIDEGISWHITMVALLSLALGLLTTGALNGLEKYRSLAVTSLASSIVLVAAMLFALQTVSLRAALLTYVGYALVRLLLQMSCVQYGMARLSSSRSECYGHAPIGEVSGFAATMAIVAALSAAGPWVLGRGLLAGDPMDLTLYVLGFQWYSLGLLLPTQFAVVLLPRLSRGVARAGLSDRNRRTVRSTAILACLASAAMSALGFAAAPLLIKFYGVQYAGHQGYLSAFLWVSAASTVTNVIYSAYLGAGKHLLWLRTTALWLGMILTLTLVMTEADRWDVLAIFATSEVARLVWTIAEARRLKLV